MRKFFSQGYWLLVLAVAGGLWLLYAIREDTASYLEEGRVTVGRVVDYGTDVDQTQVTYAFYVNGELFREKGGTSRVYKKGQYVYVLYLESDPEANVILNNRRFAKSDTILNIEIIRFDFSKQEIRDAVSGKIRKNSYK
ncbi:MAG: hypothetical protein HEP71_05675 [Roseivirga sp.]|nr:hypothetical protein [Roseivirga sp.]